MKEENYINKKECIRRGYIRKNGYIYKMSLLDKYAQKGWLEYGNPRFSKDDRLRAARRFQSDYEMSHFASVGISGTHEKIDLQTQKPIDIEAICKARENYFAAIKQIPEEFLPIVRAVCLENRELKIDRKEHNRRRSEMVYAQRRDLCRGLDRLISFYWSIKFE